MIYQDSSINWSEDVNDWIQYTSKEYVDSSILNIDYILKQEIYKTSEISTIPTLDEREQIIITTDDNVEVTTISAEKVNDDSEEIIISTDDNIDITKIEFGTTEVDDSEVLEFKSNNESETYAKIGTINGSSGLFVDNIYDLNGNILLGIDSSNDILILAGKKYKMIPYIEN